MNCRQNKSCVKVNQECIPAQLVPSTRENFKKWQDTGTIGASFWELDDWPAQLKEETGIRGHPATSLVNGLVKIEPRVQDALAGKIKVPPQEPWTEASIALALYWGAAPLTLQGILQNADIVNHAFPNPDEIAWALLMLRRRNWLSERENM